MEKKTKAWEQTTIQKLAEDSSAEHGPQTNPKIKAMDEKIRALLLRKETSRK